MCGWEGETQQLYSSWPGLPQPRRGGNQMILRIFSGLLALVLLAQLLRVVPFFLFYSEEANMAAPGCMEKY